MSILNIAAWFVLILSLVVCFGTLPVIRKVKNCSWMDAIKILLTWLGFLTEEPNEIMCDDVLGGRLLEIVNQFTDVKKLTIRECIKSDATCFSSGLPYIRVHLIPRSGVNIEDVAYCLQDAFNTHVATHYPEHLPECFIDTIKDNVDVFFKIRYAWSEEQERILKQVSDRSLNCRESKARMEHRRPVDQKLNQKLEKAMEKQEVGAVEEKKTE